MKRLLNPIVDGAEKPFKIEWLEVAELYRDLSGSDAAVEAPSIRKSEMGC